MKLLSDNPIRTQQDDVFGFDPFVDILGEAILGAQSLPFTVGVFGEWGTGKTSLLYLLQSWAKQHNCKTVWFNPWKYDEKEELWAALIRAILLEIDAHTQSDQVKDTIRTALKNIAWFTFKKGVSALSGGLVSSDDLEKTKNMVLDQSVDEHEFLNKFEATFSQLVAHYVGAGGRLVVFIDDLDRCMPENAITVLESLKLYLDNSDCVFVIGMDRVIVELGILQRYGNKIQLSGREYLEKIIQLPFFLPPVQFGHLQKALQEGSESVEDYTTQIWTLLRYGLGGNPRKAKRFVNSFFMAREALKREVHIGAIVPGKDDQTDGADIVTNPENQLFFLAKILVLQMSYTEFYDYILLNPERWARYEKAAGYKHAEHGHADETLRTLLQEHPTLALHLDNERLLTFMWRTTGEGFPALPSTSMLDRLLRFTGIVDRSGTPTSSSGSSTLKVEPGFYNDPRQQSKSPK